VILYGMLVPVVVWQVRLRTAVSIYFTYCFNNYSLLHIESIFLLSLQKIQSTVLRAVDAACRLGTTGDVHR